MTLHWPLAGEVVPFSLVALSSVFFTVDPIASILAFLAMGAHSSADRNRRHRQTRRLDLWPGFDRLCVNRQPDFHTVWHHTPRLPDCWWHPAVSNRAGDGAQPPLGNAGSGRGT